MSEKNELPLLSPLAEVDWWLRGGITELFVKGFFSAKEGEKLFFTSEIYHKNRNFLLFGIGEEFSLNTVKGQNLIEELNKTLTLLKVRNFLLILPSSINKDINLLKKHFKTFSFDVLSMISVNY